jgi:hypothetical protein
VVESNARRWGFLTLTGAAILVAGFLLGRSLGDNAGEPPFGNQPSTLSSGLAHPRVPEFPAAGKLPTLETTTVAETVPEGGPSIEPEEESGSGTGIVVPTKEEKFVPPASATTGPEVTVGKNE